MTSIADRYPMRTFAEAEASILRARAENMARLLSDEDYEALRRKLQACIAHVRYVEKKRNLLMTVTHFVKREHFAFTLNEKKRPPRDWDGLSKWDQDA